MGRDDGIVWSAWWFGDVFESSLCPVLAAFHFLG